LSQACSNQSWSSPLSSAHGGGERPGGDLQEEIEKSETHMCVWDLCTMSALYFFL
jgi:hypothetical protein